MTSRAVHVLIEGRVQGVWFRGWMTQEANARGLRGWVRNLRDGAVEATMAGAETDVEAMLELCWQGPPSARVVRVTAEPAADPGGARFGHLPTV